MDLTMFKSAEVVTDQEEIFRLVSDSIAKQPKKSSTRVVQQKDGTARFDKSTMQLTFVGKGVDGTPDYDEKDYPSFAEKAGIPWEPEYKGRVLKYWASDESSDSHGDIVLQNWIFDLFTLNPVMPFSHDWYGFPIANAIKWEVVQNRIDAVRSYQGPSLFLLGLFATKDQYEKADQAFRLAKARFLRGGSVGFSSDEIINVKDEEERARLKLGRYGVIYNKNHLMEFSPCTLGANSGAYTLLSAAKSREQLFARDMTLVREIARADASRGAMSKDEWSDVDRRYVSMAKLLFPKAEVTPHRDIDEPFEVENEDHELRHYVPKCGDDDDETKSLTTKFEELKSSLEEGLIGLSTQVQDVHALLESHFAANSGDEDDEEEDDDTADEKSVGEKGLRALLAADSQTTSLSTKLAQALTHIQHKDS